MRIKFRPGPTVRALAAPTDQSFAGYESRKPEVCVRKRGKWRCTPETEEEPTPRRAALRKRRATNRGK